MNKLGCVHLVGAGPGDPDLLTLKAWRLVTSAGAVVYDRLVGAAVLALIPAAAQRFDVGKQSGRHPLPQDGINALLVGLARRGLDVVRLKGGDPFIFGRGGEEALHLAHHGVPFDVVPGITAASGCAAAFGIPLTHRGLADGLRLVTGHRQDDRPLALDWHALADPRCTLVVYMGVASAAQLAAGLLSAGRDGATAAAVIENGTTAAQRIRFTTLDRLAADMDAWSPQPPALLVLGEVVRLAREQPGLRLEAVQ